MPRRPRIAAVVTIYHKYAHAQHIVDRFLEGYGWNGRHHRPEMDLVSLYVDQVGENDLSRDRAERFPTMTISPTIRETLTQGGDELAVDGVMLIGEHGEYETNDRGQRLYPRYEFFREIVDVFRDSGRCVPVFNDKHLSWKWEWCREMVDTAREMGFPMLAGSSLPVTWRTPSLDMPYGARVTENVCVAAGGIDGGDIHALETIQCMVERREGGESGVRWVQAYRGDAFWQAHHEGVWSRELFESAMTRSHTLTPSRPGFNNPFPTIDDLKTIVEDPIAYVYEHHDGLRSSMLLLNGLVQDFNFAASIEGRDAPLSTQMYLPMPPARTTLANFFSPQVHHIERLFATGEASYPVERTLLTSGLVIAGVDSLAAQKDEGEARIETPHLDIAYVAPEASTYWRT
jgi:hypothetical protein